MATGDITAGLVVGRKALVDRIRLERAEGHDRGGAVTPRMRRC
ncbi:hypothetical protein PPS11_07535 [Pseudomonas putida S11]|nr:hypothetical protein PPS11_07535 [Pseudomonas putida S11]